MMRAGFIVGAQRVAAEIVLETAPDGVDRVGVVLIVSMFDQHGWAHKSNPSSGGSAKLTAATQEIWDALHLVP